jgi:hypothetical protein
MGTFKPLVIGAPPAGACNVAAFEAVMDFQTPRHRGTPCRLRAAMEKAADICLETPETFKPLVIGAPPAGKANCMISGVTNTAFKPLVIGAPPAGLAFTIVVLAGVRKGVLSNLLPFPPLPPSLRWVGAAIHGGGWQEKYSDFMRLASG